MPYPPTHLLFFGLSVLVAVIILIATLSFEGNLRFRDKGFLAVLLIAGGIAALFPDVSAVWNFILNGNLRHNMIGPLPSHSILFGLITVVLASTLCYFIYLDRIKTASLGLMVGIMFFFHLVLDDFAGGNIPYLYPLSDSSFSIFDFHVLGSIIQVIRSLLF
ncbi:metal-dependent hydrolase [Methanolobus sp. ZRKC2]|uniref:metal-dependent hydrolase n=1 Tax=Methanolobus sp. ZRKC2 TaxID=3125783 RepID=UPI00325314D4